VISLGEGCTIRPGRDICEMASDPTYWRSLALERSMSSVSIRILAARAINLRCWRPWPARAA